MRILRKKYWSIDKIQVIKEGAAKQFRFAAPSFLSAIFQRSCGKKISFYRNSGQNFILYSFQMLQAKLRLSDRDLPASGELRSKPYENIIVSASFISFSVGMSGGKVLFILRAAYFDAA